MYEGCEETAEAWELLFAISMSVLGNKQLYGSCKAVSNLQP
jgi:hypothetical protein